jgi:hypothetical protein
MSRLFLVLPFLFPFCTLLAQSSLYVPRNIQRSYDKGTRSPDGKPGPNYWQNRASYVIRASLEPKTRRISGEETITYVNNSPDTLKLIRLKLAHDVYRKGSLRAGDVNPDDVDDGVTIEALTYNGQAVADKQRRRQRTFLDVRIPDTPLPPKGTSTLSLRWSYTLPADPGAARECVCDSTTFFVPYWYPQIAVYDDLRGWADAPYNGQYEFYHEFADYDVTLSMPAGFMVWATGEWQNPGDLLQKDVLDRWTKAQKSAEVVAVFKEADLKDKKVFKRGSQNTFRYKAADVPDFTFAASDHYNWDASSVVVDQSTGRRTFVSAAYHTGSKDYYRVARIAHQVVDLLSRWLPGYPFPYPSITVFNGNDGMEYPMMVNDASLGDDDPTSLTAHEVSHTYFPFMMGINEQEYAWMDEGWANFFDFYLTDSITGKPNEYVGYSFQAGTDSDVPPMVRSRNLSGGSYGIASYSRPEAAYHALLDLLGYDLFHKCMVEYMDRWKGKHPMPHDFFNTFNQVSGQNLDWFWRPWFYEWGYPDLAVEGVVRDEAANSSSVVVARRGSLPVPIRLEVTYTDGSRETFRQNAAIWRDGKQQYRVRTAAGKTVQKAQLGFRSTADGDRGNNAWPADGKR